MEELYERGRLSEKLYHQYDFYRKGFWISFGYVVWDTLASFGWL